MRTPLTWREATALAILGIIYVGLSIAELSERARRYMG